MSATTSPKTLKRREETKARLRDALLKHLSEGPFRDLRIEDVAESAGLSRSAFYFYYPDKRALLMEAAAGASAALFAEGERWWHGEGEPEELIRAALTGVSSTWAENEIVLCTAFEVSTYDPEMNAFWRQLVGGFVGATAEHIIREQEAGAVDRGIDPASTAEMLIFGAERNMYLLSTADGGRHPTDMVEPTTEIWLRALYRRSGAD